MSVEQIMYRLECGDIVIGPSFLMNGQLMCFKHFQRSKIIGIQVYEWHVKCTCCSFAQWTGMSQAEAVFQGTMHLMKPGNGSHSTYQEYVKRPAAERTWKKFQAYHDISQSTDL
jgi:hypothetical protein